MSTSRHELPNWTFIRHLRICWAPTLHFIYEGISLIWPLCTATASCKNNNQRLRAVFLSVCTLCILFTVGYEPAFTNALCMHLYDWVVVEEYFKSKEKTAQYEFTQDLRIGKRTSSVSFDDFRRAFLFLFFAIFAFFGTGNIASVSSFQPDWVRSFLTTFSPFTMTALILVKLLLPIFAATFAFRVMNYKLNVPLTTLLIVLMYCEWMGLHFLFAVKNEGSWLEIGSSVSRFVISQTITAFLTLLYLLADFYAERKIVFSQYYRPRS